MRRERLQNHIAGSVFTLPVCAIVALVLWWIPEQHAPVAEAPGAFGFLPDGLSWSWQCFVVDVPRIVAFLLMVVATCVLIEMNNRNLLLRIRSRLVSSTWLVAAATISPVHVYADGLAAAVCVAIALYTLFFTYQKRECQTGTFHWALLLGIGSIFVPFVIAFQLFFLWHQTVFLRSMSLRSFCAALVGCLFPLSIWAGYWIICDDYEPLLSWFHQLTTYVPLRPENYLGFSVQQVASWGLVTLLGILGTVHYLNTSYNDRIQVRMLLYILSFQFVATELFVCLQPQHLDTFMPLLMVTAAPLIAHFFTLTSSWFTNALFILSLLAFAALAYLNLFMPTLPLAF